MLLNPAPLLPKPSEGQHPGNPNIGSAVARVKAAQLPGTKLATGHGSLQPTLRPPLAVVLTETRVAGWGSAERKLCAPSTGPGGDMQCN